MKIFVVTSIKNLKQKGITMNIDIVCNQLREMRLTHMAQQLQERLSNADHHDLTHEQFIAILVEDEYLSRRQRRLERMINRAGFKPEQPAIEDIIYSGNRGICKRILMFFNHPNGFRMHKTLS